MEKEILVKMLKEHIAESDGILRLKPAFVARDFSTPGKRFGLPEDEYDQGERGGICERWLASVTLTDNPIPVENEGLSFLNLNDKEEITLKEVVELLPVDIMGEEYSKRGKGLSRLAKILDYSDRLPYHIHQRQHHAELVGCSSKDEAYYFPEDVPMGKMPETYFGVHPYISREKKYELLLPHMVEWKDDSILKHSRAYKQMPNDGFQVPSGILHGPGTALTIEFQEDSDVFAMMQAQTGDVTIGKNLLFKDVRSEDREKYGEKFILELIDWDLSGDPYFYENRHTPPLLVEETKQESGEENWIFYNTNKFSGKKVVVKPGQIFNSIDQGVYNILAWRGKGSFGGVEIEGENLSKDELLICHNRAVKELKIENTGDTNLILYKFFGPGINTNVPMLPKYG